MTVQIPPVRRRRCRRCLPRPPAAARATSGAAAPGAARPRRDQDCADRQELDQPGLPVGAHRRRGRREGAVREARHPDRDRLADAAGRGRAGPGAAHRPGGERGGDRGADLLLGRRQGDRRDQRRRGARRAGDDLRQRRAGVEALRVLRRGRPEDRPGGDGRARQADGREGQRRHPRRQPERAEPAQARAGRRGSGEEVPGHQDRRHLLPHRDAAGRRGRSDPRAERVSADPGLGDDRRLAAVHADAADRPRSEEGEDRRGRRAARRARLRREGAGAGAARAADLPVGLRRRSQQICRQGPPEARTCRRSSRWIWCACRRRTSASGRASSRRGASPTWTTSTCRCRSHPAPSSRTREPTPSRGDPRDPGRDVRARHQALSRRRSRSTTSASSVAAGSCHALCGENGAGKSTLGKILAGSTRRMPGGCSSAGRPVRVREPRARRSPPASAWCTRSSRSARTSRSPRTCAWGRCPRPGRSWSGREMCARAEELLAPDRRARSTCGGWSAT